MFGVPHAWPTALQSCPHAASYAAACRPASPCRCCGRRARVPSGGAPCLRWPGWSLPLPQPGCCTRRLWTPEASAGCGGTGQTPSDCWPWQPRALMWPSAPPGRLVGKFPCLRLRSTSWCSQHLALRATGTGYTPVGSCRAVLHPLLRAAHRLLRAAEAALNYCDVQPQALCDPSPCLLLPSQSHWPSHGARQATGWKEQGADTLQSGTAHACSSRPGQGARTSPCWLPCLANLCAASSSCWVRNASLPRFSAPTSHGPSLGWSHLCAKSEAWPPSSATRAVTASLNERIFSAHLDLHFPRQLAQTCTLFAR